jgi:hypothetical protein
MASVISSRSVEYPSWKGWRRGWYPLALTAFGLITIWPACVFGWQANLLAGYAPRFSLVCWTLALAYFVTFVPLVFHKLGRQIARAVQSWDEDERAPAPTSNTKGPGDGREFPVP